MTGKASGKGKFAPGEKDTRTRLMQVIAGGSLLRGTLTLREKTCGKSTCKCARGEKHEALYLVSSKDGRLRQIFVPRAQEAEVRRCIEQYKRVEELLEDISDFCWEKIKANKG